MAPGRSSLAGDRVRRGDWRRVAQGSQIAMNIVICDEHRLFSQVFAGLLERRGHCVTAQARSPESAVTAVIAHDVDICVLGINSPSSAALDAIGALLSASELARVVVLTGFRNEVLVDEALAAGASACLSKELHAERVIDVLEAVHAGAEVITRRTGLDGAPLSGEDHRHWLAGFLTEREQEVLMGLTYGESTADIAARLGVRPSTARTHIENLLNKLGVHSRVAAVAFAIQHSLVDLQR
jgi:two-component system, NarL family, nitrate/nitrite response regulator NarL